MDKLKTALKLYQAGDFAGIVALLRPLFAQKRLSDLNACILLAQAAYKTGDTALAAHSYARAGELAPGDKRLQFLKLALGLYRGLGMAGESFETARAVLALDPRSRDAAMVYRHGLHYVVPIDQMVVSHREYLEAYHAGDPFPGSVELLLNNVCWCPDEAINRMVTTLQQGRAYTEEERRARRAMPHRFGEKIRIGYLSNDFSDFHVTMTLFRGVLDHHDTDAFDITLFCYTPDNLRQRDAGFRQDPPVRIVDIAPLSDEEAAARIRACELDILVDMKGQTEGARIGLVNSGLAPIQVAYLGFPGSANGVDCDYVISDRFVTPDSSRPHYHEKLARLPDSYQCNDNRYRLRPAPTPRSALGLPEDRIVFACLNQIRKIAPETVEVWARVLKAVPDSVLWLLCELPAACDNLRAAFAAHGVSADRLVFAPFAPLNVHLARLPAADLGLDSFPCNGHTTTSDKLWMGLPVVTKRGTHFASRVSESLLNAIGLPELVAEDADGYVALAAELAADTAKRKSLKDKLAKARLQAPLFDTERYTRHLEAAFRHMVDRQKAGEAPDHFDVPPLPARPLRDCA